VEADRISGARRAGQLAAFAVMAVIATGAAFLAPVSATPVVLPAPVTLRIDAGGSHTCVVDNARAVRCWGQNNNGQLGHGLNSTPGRDIIGDDETPSTTGPVDLGGAPAQLVAAGSNHTCAVLVNSQVSCWGLNSFGRLGTGTQTSFDSAVGDNEAPEMIRVALGTNRTAKAIAAGGNHTCVITDEDKVRCWGTSYDGELGYPDEEDIVGDDERLGSVGNVDLGRRTVKAIAAGTEHTCAVTDNGSVFCWGTNEDGQLGYPDLLNKIGDDEDPIDAGPVDLGPGMKAVSITAGSAHTCARLENSKLRCWGENASGATGLGTTVLDLPPDSGHVSLLTGPGTTSDVTTADAGGGHTCAALAGAVHAVKCWGRGGDQAKDGRLGLPDLGNFDNLGDDELPSTAPALSLGGDSIVALAGGGQHTCAVTTTGTIRCWGENTYGAVGHAQGSRVEIGDDEAPDTIDPVDLGAVVT
jgi:alpha-tubulin suppressor-like RCC1 family protein